MNILLLFGTLLWLVLLAGLSVGLLVLLVVAYVRKSWSFALRSVIATIGTIVMVTGMFFGAMYLMFRPYDPSSETELRRAYEADFGKPPPAGITVLKARQVVISDCGAQWLLLSAKPKEIDQHIAMGFTKTAFPPRDFRGDAGANAPRWWQPPTNRLELYENNNWNKAGWSWSSAAIGVDRGSNLIWFVSSKID